MEIKIPFNKWSKDRLKAGMKSATSRTKRYGAIGDTFIVDGKKYVIDFVENTKLGEVADVMYDIEGANSKEEFIEIWKSIHPKKGYDPDQLIWFHGFLEFKETKRR